MPAMSRPQTAGRDMDLLKSILNNGSSNSQEGTSDDEQDAGKPRPRSGSGSSSSSTTSSGTSPSESSLKETTQQEGEDATHPESDTHEEVKTDNDEFTQLNADGEKTPGNEIFLGNLDMVQKNYQLEPEMEDSKCGPPRDYNLFSNLDMVQRNYQLEHEVEDSKCDPPVDYNVLGNLDMVQKNYQEDEDFFGSGDLIKKNETETGIEGSQLPDVKCDADKNADLKKEVSDDEATQSYQSSINSEIEPDPKPTKKGRIQQPKTTPGSKGRSTSKSRPTTKRTTKKKKKTVQDHSNTSGQNDRDSCDDLQNGNGSGADDEMGGGTQSGIETHETVRIDLNDRRDSDSSKNKPKNRRKKVIHKVDMSHHDPGSLYPDNLRGPGNGRLERNYHELQQLLQEQFIEHQEAMNKHMVSGVKQKLSGYRHRQQGVLGHIDMSHSQPPQRGWSAYKEPTTTTTQTELDEQAAIPKQYSQRRPQSAKGYYLIDATKDDYSKKVTFVEGRYSRTTTPDGGYSRTTTPDDLRNQGNQGRENATREITTETNRRTNQRRTRSAYTRRAQKPVKETKSISQSPSSSISSSPSPSRSRSRSASTDRQRSDHLLKNTDNPKIKDWLKEKNKLIRKQKRGERKKLREERKKEAEEAKGKMAIKEKSELAVKKWIVEKKKEERLLKKREQQQKGKYKFEAEVSIAETLDLKSGESVKEDGADGTNSHCEQHGNDDDNSQTDNQGQVTKVKVNMKGQETIKCTCGFVEAVTEEDEKARQARQAAKIKAAKDATNNGRKPHPPSAKKSRSNRPQSAKNRKASVPEPKRGESPVKKRLTYEDWAKLKKKDDLERRKQEKKKQEELLASSDPETDAVVSSVARKRIQNIMEGKKKIDTGIKSIDDEANRSLDEKMNGMEPGNKEDSAGKVEEVPSSTGSSVRFYKWVPKDDIVGNQTIEKRRPKSAQTRSSVSNVKNKKRPSSAIQPTRSDGKPKASKSMAESFRAEAKSPFPWKDSTGRSRSTSPKPKVKVGKPYKSVKNQQRSWDEFSDYVWDKLNEGEGEIIVGDNDNKVKAERPEPQGADAVPPVENNHKQNLPSTEKGDDGEPITSETPAEVDDSGQPAETNPRDIDAKEPNGASLTGDEVSPANRQEDALPEDETSPEADTNKSPANRQDDALPEDGTSQEVDTNKSPANRQDDALPENGTPLEVDTNKSPANRQDDALPEDGTSQEADTNKSAFLTEAVCDADVSESTEGLSKRKSVKHVSFSESVEVVEPEPVEYTQEEMEGMFADLLSSSLGVNLCPPDEPEETEEPEDDLPERSHDDMPTSKSHDPAEESHDLPAKESPDDMTAVESHDDLQAESKSTEGCDSSDATNDGTESSTAAEDFKKELENEELKLDLKDLASPEQEPNDVEGITEEPIKDKLVDDHTLTDGEDEIEKD